MAETALYANSILQQATKANTMPTPIPPRPSNPRPRRVPEPCPLRSISNNSVRRMRRSPLGSEILPDGSRRGGVLYQQRQRLRRQRAAYRSASFWLVAGVLAAALSGFIAGRTWGFQPSVPDEEEEQTVQSE